MTDALKERPTGAPGETPDWAPKTKESDFNVRNEVVSSLDWCAAFVMGQADKASDESFQEAIRDVGRKISDMSQGVKNAFNELVLARAGDGGGRRRRRDCGVESASQSLVLKRAGKRRRDRGE